MSLTPVSPLLLQRYELKYQIPMSMVEPISKYVELYCTKDYYSQISPDGFYMINSLYFDTPNHDFLVNKKNGVEPSYSLRVRSYGSNPKPPYYTEIKMKLNDFCNKMRGKVGASWAEIIQTGVIPDDVDPTTVQYVRQFMSMVETYNASPRVLTQYRRKAYLSEIDDYARVTFDRDLRFQYEEEFNLVPDESKMTHYDHEDHYDHPDENVVLELKCEKQIPVWMIDVIRKFELTRTSFSKYGSVVLETRCEPLVPRDFQSAFWR